MTPAAKAIPKTSGGSSVDWEIKEGGNDRREAQMWQADVRRMSGGKWHHSCPKQRIDVEAPFETDGGSDG